MQPRRERHSHTSTLESAVSGKNSRVQMKIIVENWIVSNMFSFYVLNEGWLQSLGNKKSNGPVLP